MKRLIFTAALIMLLAGCAAGSGEGDTAAFVPTGEIAAENAIIDIRDNGNGMYEIMADVTATFDEDGRLLWIDAENTALLAFQVSDYYEGGIYVFSAVDMDAIIEALKELPESTELEEVIEQLENHGPITGAST